jgi:hypothetical protein
MDAVSLLAFILVGLNTHRAAMTSQTVFRDLGAFLGAWFVLAPVSQIYRHPGWRSLILNWALAIPAGVLVQQGILVRPLGRGTVVFLFAALIFSLAFLVAGRLAAKFIPARWVS